MNHERSTMNVIQIEKVDERALRVTNQYRTCEAELVNLLQEMDKLRGYLHFEFTSLHDYAIRRLKLSEATTSNLITVARKAVEFPELKSAIEQGTLSVSKARKITPVLTQENKAEWLEIATTKTSREIEKAVAYERPELLIKETTKYKALDRIELKAGVCEALLRKLERIKNLESQRTSAAASFENALDKMADVYLEKFDPLLKAERAVNKAKPKLSTQSDSKSVPGQTIRTVHNNKRAALPAIVKHSVTLRDLRRCTHIYRDGSRCECTRWLDVHHITPVARGGTNEVSNLRTLCSAHHRMMHQH